MSGRPGLNPLRYMTTYTVTSAQLVSWRVVVSVHAHEQEQTKKDPADVLRTFAHRVIAEGAAVVVGHGRHLWRGVELYRGRPIFYSLGNVVGQNELTHRLPSDSYETFRIDPTQHPGELFRKRSQADRHGFPSDRRYWHYWQTVVEACRWNGGALSEIVISSRHAGAR